LIFWLADTSLTSKWRWIRCNQRNRWHRNVPELGRRVRMMHQIPETTDRHVVAEREHLSVINVESNLSYKLTQVSRPRSIDVIAGVFINGNKGVPFMEQLRHEFIFKRKIFSVREM
jgi:hypothetical protein